MFFRINGLDDFMALSTAYSTYMRVFYYVDGIMLAYGFAGPSSHMILTEQAASAESTLLASFPGAIKLDHPLDFGETIGASDWEDYQSLLNGITVSATPPQLVYYIENGNFHFTAIDPPTQLTFTCIDYSHRAGLEAEIAAAYPSVVKFNSPVAILEH